MQMWAISDKSVVNLSGPDLAQTGATTCQASSPYKADLWLNSGSQTHPGSMSSFKDKCGPEEDCRHGPYLGQKIVAMWVGLGNNALHLILLLHKWRTRFFVALKDHFCKYCSVCSVLLFRYCKQHVEVQTIIFLFLNNFMIPPRPGRTQHPTHPHPRFYSVRNIQ